jgi:excinuclease UvrABC ATPase subunit
MTHSLESPARPRAGMIAVRSARENILRTTDLELPRDKLIGFTGLMGSGNSSLASDKIYSEGQRRVRRSAVGSEDWPLPVLLLL